MGEPLRLASGRGGLPSSPSPHAGGPVMAGGPPFPSSTSPYPTAGISIVARLLSPAWVSLAVTVTQAWPWTGTSCWTGD